MRSVSVEELTGLVVEILEHYGFSAEDARTAADVLVTTDSWGVATHGTKLLRGYALRLRAGGLQAKAQPRIVTEGPAWALVDAKLALGMIAGVFGMKTAMAKARTSGIALVTVRNSCHFGAAGYYAYLAAQENMIGLAVANDAPAVAAPGSKGPVFGSNPFAFAAPGGSHPPVVLDISTAVVAGGKIRQAMAGGKAIPEGWLVDSEGKPTTDGSVYPDRGSLLPMAGHKGYGLAIMIEVLAGVLSGAALRDKVGAWVYDPEKPTNHGHAFLAIDPKIFVGADAFNSGMDELIEGVKSCPTVAGLSALSMPGEIEHNKRAAALKNGISLPDDVLESLRTAATEASIPLPASLA